MTTTRQNALAAWLIAGTLDIAYAAVTSMADGRTVLSMLQFVGSGPLGDGVKEMGWLGGLLGLATHFAIMGAMVAFFALIVRRMAWVRRLPWWVTGTAYGTGLYCFMYGIVLSSRFGAPFPNPDAIKLVIGLFPHIVLVGLPLAWLLARTEDAGGKADA